MTDASATFVAGQRFSPATRASTVAWVGPDRRRQLQLVLAVIWLLDGLLQLQGNFFTKSFATGMLDPTASGNPTVIKSPITWAGGIIGHNPVLTNSIFAAIQILLGLAIAYRPTLKAGLAASVVWGVGVWWFGEGLGGVLSGTANPVTGAPGAVIIYVLLAVLLWPTVRRESAFEAGRFVGTRTAQALWVLLWAPLAYFSLTASNRAAFGLENTFSGLASGEPGWVAAIDRGAARFAGGGGLTLMVILAILMAVIAVSVFFPASAANPVLVGAVILSLVIWVVGQNFGAILVGGATDVNSGPLLALLALAYWRNRPSPAAGSAGSATSAGSAGSGVEAVRS